MKIVPHPCFCGCGGVACWLDPGVHVSDSASRYLPGHAPSERAAAPLPLTPSAKRKTEAGAAAAPQGDLFGASPSDRWRPARKRLTS